MTTPERDGAAVEAVVREWPCDDYLPPLTCWTTPKLKMLICAGCRESFPSGPDVQTAIAAREAAAKAEALREAAGALLPEVHESAHREVVANEHMSDRTSAHVALDVATTWLLERADREAS